MKKLSALRTMRNFTCPLTWLSAAALLTGFSMESAQAHVIERIEINPAGNEAEIQIIFDVRIQYLRETSLGNGEVHLYFNPLDPDPDANNPVNENKVSPPSDIAPHFTVSYPELDSALDIKFDKQIEYRVRPGIDGRSISIFIPAIKPTVEPLSATQPQLSPEEIELEAKKLIASARDALVQGQIVLTIESLNRLLDLPPNQQSQPAQKLIGEAREKNSEFAKARVEYELYLKLYPDAADAEQVKERLAHLPAAAPKLSPTARRKKSEEGMTVYGSVTQNYYKGVLHSDATDTVNGTQSSWSGTDQSMLVSSLDMTGRERTETTDTRLVVRDDYNANFLRNQHSKNRLSSAYVEQSARDHSYLYRVGRQMGSTGGVLGRFDGAWVGYSPDAAWRVNGVVGSPVDFYNTAADRKVFTGMSVDLTRLPEQWSGSAYLIQQRVGSVTDRQAVGTEAHYFDIRSNYSGLLDYDTLFRTVNIATLQGNWTNTSGGNYNLLVDHRKSPTMQLTNALQGQSTQSITTLLTQPGVTVSTLRADAQTITSISNLIMIGTTQPYTAHWRLGGDFRILNTTGTGALGTLPAAPGTGNIYIYSAQAIGSNLLVENDMSMVSASLISAPSYKGHSIGLNRIEAFQKFWRLDMSLQYYAQNGLQNDTSYHQTRITPSLKVSYRMDDSMSFEAEGGIENNRTNSATGTFNSRRQYYYLGYRWDFR